MKEQKQKTSIQEFQVEKITTPDLIKGGPRTSRGTVTTVQPTSGGG